jgi:hypothetical protein
VAGFYVESVAIVSVCLSVVFLVAVQQGMNNPKRKYSKTCTPAGRDSWMVLATSKDAIQVKKRGFKLGLMTWP